ncbi:peptidyl-prolyl cis-trans isomerase g isoform x1 [Dermatophagoides farinae]|uniref:peptidylprolyl isomerase n=1 Tax=Dermatophagoides farinae TaxID=6954 RepID=A0A9D4NYW6_DERFA|nr:peptidyl-prolyl cis-trans isomerase g isoform x1 [Dermatophagoides farinae]
MVKLKQLRPRCFFDISIDGKNAGRVIFELFNEKCPKTCENFKALCTGEKGIGQLTGKPLHYKNVSFHRIINNFMIQSGDFSQNNGKGGESIFGGTFKDESFDFKHERPFLLSMANRGPNTNGSQFFITLVPTPHLDGVHVVFGHVIAGQDVVMKIAQQSVDKQSRPIVPVCISNCGELVPQIKPKEKTLSVDKQSHKKRRKHSDESDTSGDSDSDSSSNSSSSSSESDDDSSSKEKDKKQTTNPVEKNPDNTEIEQNENSISLFNPKYSVRIDPEEIPEIPQNRFLHRGIRQSPSILDDAITNKEKEDSNKNRSQSSNYRNDRSYGRRIIYTSSGRKIKGRGSIRYRTPSPDDNGRYSRKSSRQWRRSETPPYWRAEQAKLRPWKQIISSSPAKYRDRKIDENSIQKRKFREFPSPRSSYSPEKRNSISKHKPSRKSSKEKENRHDPQSESNNNNTHRRIIDDNKRKDD